ncbi:MAG: Hypothetical protein AJITA_00056 [Acetilactobacillus jinshanensis]
MPHGIIGSLIIASALFIIVSLVLVGMFKYTTTPATPNRSAGRCGKATTF